MATEADNSDLISPMKTEAEDKEHISGNSTIVKEELIEVNEGIVKSIEGDKFLQSPSFIDGEVEKNLEDNQVNTIRKMDGSQNGDKIDMKTDENNPKHASEPTDFSQGTAFDIEKVSDVCPLKEKSDDTLTAEAILSQQDSTETSFEEEDGSQNKSSESPLTKKVDNVEISKQELDHEAKDTVEDNLKDESEALGNVEKIVTEASEEIKTTPPSETPDQIPAKEDVTTISSDIKVFATPEEKNHAAIDLYGETDVAVTDKSGDYSNATYPLVEEEVQITSEKLDQAPIVETEGQVLEVSEGSEGALEGNSSNNVIQTEKHFDRNDDDQIIKEEEYEEPKVTNEREKIEQDVNNETLAVPAIERNCEDMTSGIRENKTVADIGNEEEREEPSTLKEPENKIENDTEKSENVSSLNSQALEEEVYEAKMEDTIYAEKADTASPRITETTSMTEIEPCDNSLEEASIVKAHLPEHENKNEDLERAENLDAQSGSHVQAVQDVYEITTSPNAEESGVNNISDLISPMKIEAEDRENISGNSTIVKEELIEVNEDIVKSIEGENFLQPPLFIDGEVERNTEDNQLNSIRKMNGSQNGDKIDMKTEENNSKPASEPTECSQGTSFDIEKVSDVCPLKEKRDDTITGEAILSQQDSTETSFKEEDGSQNKSSESPLTEKVDNIEISKQDLDYEAKDIVEENLNDKSEPLGKVEMLVTEASEEIETTPPNETPDQNPAKEDVTTISDDIRVSATPEEKNHAAIDLNEENGETDVTVTDKSGNYSNATSLLVEEEVQNTSLKLDEAPIVEPEGQVLEVSEGSEGALEGNSSNNVVQTEKHFDRNDDDQIIKEEEFEEPKVTNEKEKIEKDVNNETLAVPAIERNYEDMTSGVRENKTVADTGIEEEPEEPSTLKEPENKIESETEKSENVSSLNSQALKEEVYEAKKEDATYAEKADTAPSKIVETTSMTEVEPCDKSLEEASIAKDHLPEHEIENEDLERAENLDAQSGSHVQAVQDVYEITTSPNVEESGANNIEKIIREVPEELSAADNNDENGESETNTQIEDKAELEGSDAMFESKDQNIEEIHEAITSASAEKYEVSENNETETSKSKRNPDFHGIEEIEEIQAPFAEQIPTEEEKEELNPVPETGNTVDEIQNIKNKTETELVNQDADEDRENLSELTLEPKVQCVEGIDESAPKPPVSQTQVGKATEEPKYVPEAVFEPTTRNVEEAHVTSSEAGQIEDLNREAPETFYEPTYQIIEAVDNDDTVTPAVAASLTSSKEFHFNGEAENVTDSVSSEKNIETTGNADSVQQDEGVEKTIPEDASTSVPDYADEDVKKESESVKIEEEVGEARTPITTYESKEVYEDASEAELSSAVDESNINEIPKVEKEVPEELPEAITEDVEAENEGSPDQEIMKSDAEDVIEENTSKPVIQSKPLSVEGMDGFDPTHSNFQEVGTIIDEEVIPNQTLLTESKEQLTEPCSTLVDDQHHETTAEVEMVTSESINKNDRLNEDAADSIETVTTGNVEQRELNISNSDVTAQNSQTEATETEIDEEKMNEKMKCGEGESKLSNDQINAFGTSSETTIPESIKTVDTTTKIQETSNVESQLQSCENETEVCENIIAENEDAEILEAEYSEDQNVEEIPKTDTSLALGDTETSEIDNEVREAPRAIHQLYEADRSEEIALGQKIQAENREAIEVFPKPANKAEEVSNDDFISPTVATELPSSKEFQLGGELENITNSSAENIETTKKADSQLDEGIAKIVLEDASTAVSDYVQEDEEKDSESSKVDEEVGEARTVVTIPEHKDLVVEHARETDLSFAVDESNINEISNVEKEIPEKLPEAINEAVKAGREIVSDQETAENKEAGSEIVPNQETAENKEACESNDHCFDETREMKTEQSLENTETYKMVEENIEAQPSELIKLPNVIGLEEINEPEPTPLAKDVYEDEEKEEVDRREIEVTTKNETGACNSDAKEIQKGKASEPVIEPKAICDEEADELDTATAVGKMPTNEEREEIEAAPAVRTIFNDDISPNQTLPVESKEQLIEPCSVSVQDQHHETLTEVENVKPECTNKNDTWLNEDKADLLETVDQKELETLNSDVTAQDTQDGETEVIHEDKRDDGADVAVTTGTEVTLVGESELVNKPINTFGTSSETTIPKTMETFDTSEICKISNVDSQLIAHDNETEVCESFTAETDAENVEVVNSEVHSAESEFIAHNVKEIHETDTSAAMEDTHASEAEKTVREVPGVINRVYEADHGDEISHDRKIQAENTDPVQVPSFVFLPSEESHESKEITIESTEDGHMKKDDTEENNLKPQEVTGVDPVKAEKTPDVETVNDDEASEKPLALGALDEESQESSSTILSKKQGETKTETNVLGVQEVYENDSTADVEETHADKIEEETKEVLETIHEPKCQNIGVITDRESISNQTFPPKITENTKDGFEDTDIALTPASEVRCIKEIELSDEAAKDVDISSESKAPETIEFMGIKPEEACIVELTHAEHENKEAHKSVTAEKTDAHDVEAEKVLDEESEYLSVEEIHGTKANPIVGETDIDESEKVVPEVPKALPEGNNQGPEADSNDEIIPSWTSQAEKIEEEVSKSPSVFLSSEESQENVTTTTENTEDEREKVTQEVLQALPEGNNKGLEADSNDEIIPSWTSQAEKIEEEVSKSPSVFLSSEESQENVTTTTENTEDGREKVKQEVLQALPEGNNKGLEADSNDEFIPSWTSQAEKIEEEVSKTPSVFLSSEESQENVTTTTENTEDEREKITQEVLQALPEGINRGPEAGSNDEIIPSWTSQAEKIEEEVSKSPSVFLASEESQENVTTTTENTEDEREKVTQEVLKALPEDINRGPEAFSNDEIPLSCTSQAENIEEEVSSSSSVFLSSEERHRTTTKDTEDDSLKVQETSGMLPQLQTIEIRETTEADEVEAEEAKSFDAVYKSKDHLDEIHETKTSLIAEISNEDKMEEATSITEEISDVEAVFDDVPADKSTSISKCPTENTDICANITHSADDKPAEVIISELIPESRVLNVEEIKTEMSPSVTKAQDKEEDETKTVIETTFEPDHEDAAEIIARYIISNQTFPDENKEDEHKRVEETEISPATIVKDANIEEINPIDKDIHEIKETIQTDNTTALESEIDKSQIQEHETEKIAHQNIVQNVQEINDKSTSQILGESDANERVNISDVEEPFVTEPNEQVVEDTHKTDSSPIVVVGADMNGSHQETIESPETIIKEINQDAGKVNKKEDSSIQHTQFEKREEKGFDLVPESQDQNFEEAHDKKAITAAETPNIVHVEEAYTGVEAIDDGQTQATGTVPETVLEPNDHGVGENINKDINTKDIIQNESISQQNEPCLALLKDQAQEIVVEDGMIKAEDTNQTDASSNENAIDSFEEGTAVEKSSSKPVDESNEAFDLEFEKIEKALRTDSENINVSEVDPIPKVTDNIDGQLEKSVTSKGECETRIENATDAAQAIHEITSKKSLTEEPEKAEADNPIREPITADNSNVETPEQVSVGTKTANTVYAEEEKNEKYAEDESITEIEGREYEYLATESTRSVEEVKSFQVTLEKPEDKLEDDSEKDETAVTNINNFENRVEKEKMENESHVPAYEKNGTKGSVYIAEQEPTANVADLPSSKSTTDEELAVKGEIMVDEKQSDFILDPVSVNSSMDEKVEKVAIVPTTNNQESLGEVTEPSKIMMEPQEEEKLFPSQAQIAKEEYLNEEKENKNSIASTDFQVIPEGKHGEESPETTNKTTPKHPAEVSLSEILHKSADQTKQMTETESEEKVLVEEAKTDEEEDDEHKRANSGSDDPVMVEASRDIDVKTPTKKSHNILSGVGSKVKHSIAKVKKAITGKSSNQKSSPKEDKKTEAILLL